MIGLALEGGGTRGAFHMGVIKAFLDEGYEIGGVTGTSVGALNAAILVQGSFEEGCRIWENLNPSDIFDMDEEDYRKLINHPLDRKTALRLAAVISRVLRNRGIDTGKLRNFLENILDEEKIRRSPMDFGLVTISLTELKPLELYKEDIPEGRMIDYLVASASFPGFKPAEIGKEHYIDGGLYDNCPVNLLARKGYREIYAVRTLGPGFLKETKDPDVKVVHILPSEYLGRIFDFSRDLIRRNMKMGYYDGLRLLRGLKGSRYYIAPGKEERVIHALHRLSDTHVRELAGLFGMDREVSEDAFFEKILPEIGRRLKLKKEAGFQDIILALLERLAEEQGLYKYQIYEFSDFISAVKKGKMPETDDDSGIAAAIRDMVTESLTGKRRLLKAARIIAECIDPV